MNEPLGSRILSTGPWSVSHRSISQRTKCTLDSIVYLVVDPELLPPAEVRVMKRILRDLFDMAFGTENKGQPRLIICCCARELHTSPLVNLRQLSDAAGFGGEGTRLCGAGGTRSGLAPPCTRLGTDPSPPATAVAPVPTFRKSSGSWSCRIHRGPVSDVSAAANVMNPPHESGLLDAIPGTSSDWPSRSLSMWLAECTLCAACCVPE